MKRKHKPIVLSKLIDQSAHELRIMTAELCTGKPEKACEAGGPSRWSRRFAASGKQNKAPKLIQS